MQRSPISDGTLAHYLIGGGDCGPIVDIPNQDTAAMLIFTKQIQRRIKSITRMAINIQ